MLYGLLCVLENQICTLEDNSVITFKASYLKLISFCGDLRRFTRLLLFYSVLFFLRRTNFSLRRVDISMSSGS